jgi:acetoin utilization protein AcuB
MQNSPTLFLEFRNRLYISSIGGINMLVRKKMQKNITTITKDERMTTAKKILKEKNIRHLPVVEGKKLIGLVTNMDIRKSEASSATSLEIRELHYLLDKITVGEIMTRNVITISPDISIEEATTLLHDNKIGCLPVIEDGNLVGLLTEGDVMEVLIEVMGMKEKGSRIEILVDDMPGALAEITRIIKEHNVNIVSLVTDTGDEPGKRLVVLKLKTFYFEPIKKALETAKFAVQYAKIEK